jgi:hypothetical protein
MPDEKNKVLSRVTGDFQKSAFLHKKTASSRRRLMIFSVDAVLYPVVSYRHNNSSRKPIYVCSSHGSF